MSESPWQFWIDVGGTFTDCFARAPGGLVRSKKVLSSGVIKGTVADGSSENCIIDPRRDPDPVGVWQGYRFRLLGDHGEILAESRVVESTCEPGQLQVDPPLPRPHLEVGGRYELYSDEESPLVAIRYLLGIGRAATIPPVAVRLGTTRGTNALLTRKGAACAFVTTSGFADVLLIGYQDRAKLFDLDIVKPTPLFSAVAEIDERMSADGNVLQTPSEAQIRQRLAALKSEGIESLAICLLNSYANPAHEEVVERVARDLGFVEISRSSQLASLIKIVARGDTTVVDAYLNPVLRTYLDRLQVSLGTGSSLHLLTSAGGLVAADAFTGKDSLFSGPAGGGVGFWPAVVPENGRRRGAQGFSMFRYLVDIPTELANRVEKCRVRF